MSYHLCSQQNHGKGAGANGRYLEHRGAHSQPASEPSRHLPRQANSPTMATQDAGYDQNQQTGASTLGRSRSSLKTRENKAHGPAGFLLEVERQWAAYYEQQRRSGVYEYGDESVQQRRRIEPDFVAFTIAGGKIYLEEGGPTQASKISSENSQSSHRIAGEHWRKKTI
ncbi:uncharacterized protein PV09_06542 [Verruconis gallopava]|uniref:Uncharacterized protein n=1 Tax=Verruconis gallopava TaxID=253628 RepID=A0A0D2A685_9PEZI|nr:uncharacterized protein PV09_06542 [Verruconis gallopava]KIW02040.1 hypothetical protein PV09_06542 [Verruconis gallopava]